MKSLSELKQFLGVVPLVAILITLMGIYNFVYVFPTVMVHRISFTLCSLIVIFMSPKWKSSSKLWKAIDVFFVISFVLAIFYVIMHMERIADRIPYVDELTFLDKVFGVIIMVGLIEGTRRVCGKGLAIVALVFIAYAFWGYLIPGAFSHSGMSLTDFIDLQWLTTGGIFGIPVAVVSGMVFYFLLFAAFLGTSGGGKLFMDLAIWSTGRMRGGSAKCAVIASSAMGSINGAAVANVVGTGVFTIPLMKKSGFSDDFAGAVEASASTGGQLMPPVMGAVAFVMAEITGYPYSRIALAALFPSLLYYTAIFIMVDMKAKQAGIRALRKDELPPLNESLYRIHLLIPLILLVYGILTDYSLMKAATYATGAIIAVSFFSRMTRFNIASFIKSLQIAGQDCAQVIIPCAAAGVLIGVVINTGMGVKLTAMILQLAAGSTALALFTVMIACFLLGMGMTTVAAYIMVVILMIPALTEMGIGLLPAHMFAFYFAILSMVTPPVAVASYAAAGVAGSNATKTGWIAFTLCSAGFIVPFVFVYNPALVLEGTVIETIRVFVGAVIGIYGMAGALMGLYISPVSVWLRLVGGAGGLLLIAPSITTDILGIGVIASILGWQFFSGRRSRRVEGRGKETLMTGPSTSD